MKAHAAVFAVVLVGACAPSAPTPDGPDIAEIDRACGASFLTFAHYWPCQRARLTSSEYHRMPPDVLASYVATGNVVFERVRAGLITDVEARLAMGQARAEAQQIMMSRAVPTTRLSPQVERVAPNPGISD
jgi:hypothetical protein